MKGVELTRDQEEHALELHRRAIVVDFHCDVVLATLPDSAFLIGGGVKRTLAERSTEGHVDIPRLLEGGVDCQVFSHFVEPIYNPIATRRMLQVMGYSLSEIEKNSDKLEVVTKAEEIYRNHGKKISVIIGFEGGEAIDQDLRLLRMFYRLGLRRLTLCWNNRNAIADGVRWQRSKGGLTEFGASVVEECNKLGILVDVSHLTDPGFWDVLEVSKDPVIASHSNCRALCPSMRNLTDEMIKALAEKGGVIGVNYAQFFLIGREELKKGKVATVETVVDHIDHIVDVTGNIDHVGLGSDFDGVPRVAEGLEDVSKLPNLTKSLVARGYSDQEIEKILGGNFLRVVKTVWK
ncbi:membrane dipeptidase [Candidatus Bathyarchaeota archaeon]|nr:MAG: membrane dipeptidase [Candidatus Bathyarchaeota archaeon]